jgi:hypothetical protein
MDADKFLTELENSFNHSYLASDKRIVGLVLI